MRLLMLWKKSLKTKESFGRRSKISKKNWQKEQTHQAFTFLSYDVLCRLNRTSL